MNRILTITLSILAFALAVVPAAFATELPPTPPVPPVSSSAVLITDPAGDASPAADLTEFSLYQDAARIHFGFAFAHTVRVHDQQLLVCAVGHERIMCIVSPTKVRIDGKNHPAKISYSRHGVKVSVLATALVYKASATSRTIRFRAKTSITASACGGPCTDYSGAAVVGLDL